MPALRAAPMYLNRAASIRLNSSRILSIAEGGRWSGELSQLTFRSRLTKEEVVSALLEGGEAGCGCRLLKGDACEKWLDYIYNIQSPLLNREQKKIRERGGFKRGQLKIDDY